MKYLKIPALSLFVLLAGCSFFSGTRHVFDMADSVTQHAKASLLLHNAIGTQVAVFVESPDVTETRKAQARNTYRLTVCSAGDEAGVAIENCREGPAYQADMAVEAYEAIHSAQTETELLSALDSLVPLLLEVSDIINGEQP
jgi:hypothetical protein